MSDLRIYNGRLQQLVNTSVCDKPGCLVYHWPKWEWVDVPQVTGFDDNKAKEQSDHD